MALLKSEAIVTLCIEMGGADGEFSEQEMASVCRNPEFLKLDWDSDLFGEKIKRGEATHRNAVSSLKGCSLDSQIDALALVWHVLLADGVMTEGEKGVMARLLTEFDIDIDSVNNRLQNMVS
ncbi:MAG TPA: hypothetical protein QF458_05330 [Candidatus Woesearchaeota archaeon]|jgi:uncharacterized tellurite resistance protein B-like protein|nr:hypothetical protein [Candidatus Woesearchaeota archaeon]|tara:strand:+ start:2677 stop:3042 length:366 start_codon:yes stop_codon:yes gene_type:complete